MVMELLEGKDLGAEVRSARALAVADAVDYVIKRSDRPAAPKVVVLKLVQQVCGSR
jgi:hypothetical protein